MSDTKGVLPLPSGITIRLKRPTLEDYLHASTIASGSAEMLTDDALLKLIVTEVDGEPRTYVGNTKDWRLTPRDCLALRAAVNQRIAVSPEALDAAMASLSVKHSAVGTLHRVDTGSRAVLFRAPTMGAQLQAVRDDSLTRLALSLLVDSQGSPSVPEDLTLEEALLLTDVIYKTHYASSEDVASVGNAIGALWGDDE